MRVEKLRKGALPVGAHLIRKVEVLVVSDDGWSWVYAWRQLGARSINCLPLTETSRSQIQKVIDELGEVRIVQPPQALASLGQTIIAAELRQPGHERARTLWRAVRQTPVVMFAYARHEGTKADEKAARELAPPTWYWRYFTARHHRLGGLTNARTTVMWGSKDMPPPHTSVNGSTDIARQFGQFLETMPRNVSWTRKRPLDTNLWCPNTAGAKPIPWPTRLTELRIRTSFPPRNDKPVEEIFRTLSNKELCQVLDIRLDLARNAITAVCNWREGAPIPVRFLSAFVFDAIDWLSTALKLDRRDIDTGPPTAGVSARMPIPTELTRGDGSSNHFSWVWDPKDSLEVSKAVKADSAGIDTEMWAVGGKDAQHAKARHGLRIFLHRIWCRRLTREALAWLCKRRKESPDAADVERDVEGIRECVTRAANSTWWEWADGSRLFFWRWPSAWQREARDGAKAFHLSFPKQRLYFPEKPITDQWVKQLDDEKLEKLIVRRYLEPTTAKELVVTIPRGQVPKGKVDIRVVWDLTRNGVNPTLYTPSFFLATVATLCRRIQTADFQGDFDIGEQFHNFQLHPFERPMCGVRIPESLIKSVDGATKWMRWCRAPFGWSPSPYLTLRMLARALELAKGNLDDSDNPFGWTVVRENYPCQPNYDPSKPRLILVKADGSRAAVCISFFDDGRIVGQTEPLVNQAIRQICSRIQRLGNQDAARKRRPVSQRAGAWCGGVVHTDQGMARKFVGQEKWDRTKEILEWFRQKLQKNDRIDRATFLKHRGFLVHITLTYEHFRPFMKGFHLSAESWREERDADGWPIKKRSQWDRNDPWSLERVEEEDRDGDGDMEVIGDLGNGAPPWKGKEMGTPPEFVEPVPRFEHDIAALEFLTQSESPMMVILRPVQDTPLALAYGFGDASGEGYGSYISASGEHPTIRTGFWCKAVAEMSSNYRELRNLVELVEEEVKGDRLRGREVWIFTDNAVAEAVYYKGASTDKALFDLMLQLRTLTIDGQFLLHIVHIAGTRMIAQGTDGLSRGETYLDSLLTPIDDMVPLHRSPTNRSPALRDWVTSWAGESPQVAGARQWFRDAQQPPGDGERKLWLWDLPPAAALDALEELGLARLRRHDSMTGIVLVPLLLRPEWLRRFVKTVDLYFVLPAGALPEVWPRHMHEPLMIGLFFPLLRYRPWDWKAVPFMAQLGRTLSTMHRLGDPEGRDLLREFWAARAWVATMPERLVSDVLSTTAWHKLLGVARRRLGGRCK